MGSDGVIVGVGEGFGVEVGEYETVTDGVGVVIGVDDGVGVGVGVCVLVGIGVNGKVSFCKNVMNLYCAEVKLFLSDVIPYEYTVLTSFGFSISLLRIKRLSHST